MNDSAVVNINVGILGHVDSGKTSLAKALSTTASTAAFDKNPQSKERGITIDLGFSCFRLDVDEIFAPEFVKHNLRTVQVTLVDCPGHASLIRTVIGGAQIIDICLLVIDAVKGIQTQTAECLIVAEITAPRQMIVVVNKIDLIPEVERETKLNKLEKRLRKTLEMTTFKNCPIVFLSACVGADAEAPQSLQLDCLLNTLKRTLTLPDRNEARSAFVMQVDHCFPIKGHGTVLTGTVLAGSLKLNDDVYLPSLGEQRKVKSMQMFRQSVAACAQGDRVALCVRQIESAKFERGLICAQGATHVIYGAIVSYNRIAYFKQTMASKSRFHVTIGHETVMARCRLLVHSDASDDSAKSVQFDENAEYLCIDEQSFEDAKDRDAQRTLYALLEFDHELIVPKVQETKYIASRLDADVHTSTCRLAFYGRILHPFTNADYRSTYLPTLNVVKYKQRTGVVERIHDEHTLIVHSLIKRETDVTMFERLKVHLDSGETGFIEGAFGKSGKLRIRLDNDLTPETRERIESRKNNKDERQKPVQVTLKFKKRVFDKKSAKMQQ